MTPPESESPFGEPMESVGTAHFDSAARALRWVFFAMGIPVGTLVPRLAEIKAGLDAGNAAYGTAIAIGGAGAFLGSWVGGRLTHAFGSRTVARFGISFILLTTISNALAPSVMWLALIAFGSGLAYSCTNIAANSQAVLIEQGLRRSFIPRAHAFWSLGTMTSALLSSLAAPHVTPLTSLCVGSVVSLVLFQWAARGLLTTEHEDRPHDDPAQLPRNERMPRGTLIFLATLAFAQTLALIAEFSVSDWGSVLLHQEFHIAVGPNGYAYTAFMLVQLATRLYAPGLIDRLGLQVAIRAFGIVGTIGYVTCLLGAGFASDRSQVATLVLSCLAYAFLGAAVGPMPSAFTTAAGSIPGLPSARALAVTGLIISVGGMIGRVAFAQVAQVVTLSLALTLMGVLVLITVAMTFVLVPARAEQHAIRR